MDAIAAVFTFLAVILYFFESTPKWMHVLVVIVIIIGGFLWLLFGESSGGLTEGGGGSSEGSDKKYQKEKETNYSELTNCYDSDTGYHIDEYGRVYKRYKQIGYIDEYGNINKIGSDYGQVGYIDDDGNIRNKDGLSISRGNTTQDKIRDIGAMIKGKHDHD